MIGFCIFVRPNDVLSKQQFGFRKRKGTGTAIAIAYEKIALNQLNKQHCDVICRDVAKAFDWVWIDGLRFKIMNQEDLPLLLKKILYSFTQERTAQIKINITIGPQFQLKAGVPQGSILSPSLFIFYTHDMPASDSNTDVIFADDVAQIVEHHGGDREELAVQSEREIVGVSEFEKKWKIKTNANKFKMVSISKTQPYPVSVDDTNMPFTNDINLLGLTPTRTGFFKHISSKINQAKHQMLKLKRFYKLSPKL